CVLASLENALLKTSTSWNSPHTVYNTGCPSLLRPDMKKDLPTISEYSWSSSSRWSLSIP
ncbi:hypothetical protein LINGRAHAP2_LOCUS5417, partial [Linum grandiflorum]